MNRHEHASRSGFKEESSLVGIIRSSKVQVLRCNRGIKVTKGSITILKEERIANLYKLKEIIIVDYASVATEKEDNTRL